MARYLVTLNMPRNKVRIIKMYRAVTGAGLKESKDAVEAAFNFDGNDTRITATIEMSDAALGRYYAWEMSQTTDYDYEYAISPVFAEKIEEISNPATLILE